MKRTLVFITIFMVALCIFLCSPVYASSNSNTRSSEIISNETKGQLVSLTNKELQSIKDYQEAYGSDTYGLVAYILDKIRVYIIPFTFLGLAISGIYQYITGMRNLEKRDKGFNGMIAIITVFVICQVLPLIFAIVVKGWRG